MNDHILVKQKARSLSGSASIKIAATLIITALVAYPLASATSTKTNLSHTNDASTTATSTIKSSSNAQHGATLVVPNDKQNTNIVTKTPEGFTVKNVEGFVEITSQPSVKQSYQSEASVSTYYSQGNEVVTQGQTTVEYNDPNSKQPTTIVKGGNKAVNKSSNVSISITSDGNNTSSNENGVEVENETRVRIRGDSP